MHHIVTGPRAAYCPNSISRYTSGSATKHRNTAYGRRKAPTGKEDEGLFTPRINVAACVAAWKDYTDLNSSINTSIDVSVATRVKNQMGFGLI